MVFKTSKLWALVLPLAGMAHAASYTSWSDHKSIVLNTSATGANVASTVTNFPLLVRLGANESAILSGANNGASIRFSKADDATPLAYQIESWSNTGAVIWVKVDSVKGNNATQSIRLHYGNGSVSSESSGSAVFDTANGFRGVWHLQDSTGSASSDATIFGTKAMWNNGPVLANGLIGKAVNLNQPVDLAPETAHFLRADYNVSNNNFKATSANGITLSVWVKRTLNTGGTEQGIFGRYNWGQNARQAMIALNGSDQIRLFRSTDGTNAGGAETNFGNVTIEDGSWFHIVATLKNGSQILYVNGVQDVAQTTATMGSLDSIWATSSALSFGRMAADHAGNPVAQAFDGLMDEARFTSTARSADWVKLEYESQKNANTLTNIGLPTLPGAPTGVTGVPSNAQVTLTWLAADDGGSTITSYKAMVVGDTAKTCTGGSNLTCTIAGLTNGTAYTFQVRAYNVIGAGPVSAASGAVTPNAVAPGAPGNVGAVNASTAGSIVVSWIPPANTGGSAITGYKVVTSGDTAKSCVTTTALTCNVTGLTAGQLYTFFVYASNTIGRGPAGISNQVTGIRTSSAYLLHTNGFARMYTFRLPEGTQGSTEDLKMSITDVFGRTVWSKTLRPSEVNAREISWNGKTTAGIQASAGLYFVRVNVISGAKSSEYTLKGITLQPGK